MSVWCNVCIYMKCEDLRGHVHEVCVCSARMPNQCTALVDLYVHGTPVHIKYFIGSLKLQSGNSFAVHTYNRH